MIKKKRTTHETKAEVRQSADAESPGLDSASGRGWIVSIAVALFLVRYLLTTESAEMGHTCVLCAAWIGLAALVSYLDWRADRRWQFDWRDVVIGLIAVPPIVSGFVSQFVALNQRAAQNMLLEWVSLSVSMLLLRRFLDTPGTRRILTAGVVSIFASIACYGLWQHYVWYPSTAAQLTEYEELEKLVAPSSAELARRQELFRSLGPEYVGGDATSRRLLRDRLVNSTEPLGFFALANTLVGLLGVAAVWIILSQWSSVSREQVLRGTVLAAVVIAFVLCKSRTAYVAASAATALGVLLYFGKHVPWRRVGIGCSLAFGVVLLLLATGSLDLEVLTESSVSFKYRMEYWKATLAMLGDSWITGSGLGNFRSAYLAYKLPGASEEIIDPHNWILEAWTAGGIVGLIATVGGVALLLVAGFRTALATDDRSKPDVSGRVRAPIVIATCIALVWNGLPVHVEYPVLLVGAGALLVASFSRWTWSERNAKIAALVATVLLCVHLLASGGYGMPAVMQTLLAALVIWPCGSVGAKPSTLGFSVSGKKFHGVQAALVGCLVLALVFVVRPNLGRDRWIADAESRIHFENDFDGAIRSLKKANLADPIAPEPLARLASYYASRNRVELARQSALDALAADPRSPSLKQWAASLMHDLGDNETAAELLSEAVAGYPNGADVRADAAEIYAKIGDSRARNEALKAIELDNLNQTAGHADKVFSDVRRQRLVAIVGETGGE